MQIGDRFNPTGLFTYIVIPDCIKRNTELSPIDKLVWGQLHSCAGKDGECYPKQTTIAEEIGVSERSIRNSIQTLIDMGFIEVEKPTGKDKLLHLNDRYYFIWHRLYECTIQTGTSCRTEKEPHADPNKLLNNKLLNKEESLTPITPFSEKPKTSINRRSRTVPPPKEDPDAPFKRIATALYKICSKHYPNNIITEHQVNSWLPPIRKIFKVWKGTPEKLLEWLHIYYNEFDRNDKYHTVIRSGKGLLERMEDGKLEGFVNKARRQKKPEAPIPKTEQQATLPYMEPTKKPRFHDPNWDIYDPTPLRD